MEVLETARVDAYCKNDVVIPASKRSDFLCVVWEGTCVERDRSASANSRKEKLAKISSNKKNLSTIDESGAKDSFGTVWYAGDWTGPIALQPEKRLSGESELSETHDVVAMAHEGVKVITIDFASLHQILKSGSQLYTKYLERRQLQQERRSSFQSSQGSSTSTPTHKILEEAMKSLNVLELLDQNSALRKLSAVQKRHLESLAEGPIAFGPGERLWRAGAPVDKAFMVVGGTASFVPRRRNAGSVTVPSSGNLGISSNTRALLSRLGDSTKGLVKGSQEGPSHVGADMQNDVIIALEEMGETTDAASKEESNPAEMVQLESLFSRSGDGQAKSVTEAYDFAKLSKNLQQRAESLNNGDHHSDLSVGSSQDSASGDSDHFGEEFGHPGALGGGNRRASLTRRRSSRARFANKVLGRLYSRRAFTGGLVFSRGHFLGDVSKMVAGLLSSDYDHSDQDDSSFPVYGFGDKIEGAKKPVSDNLTDMVIHEQEGDSHIMHSSTLTAGNDGCVVLVFPRESLIPFLDEYPGLLLSLLGTQVVV
jgi:CRP-like cAMP-binding protein